MAVSVLRRMIAWCERAEPACLFLVVDCALTSRKPRLAVISRRFGGFADSGPCPCACRATAGESPVPHVAGATKPNLDIASFLIADA